MPFIGILARATIVFGLTTPLVITSVIACSSNGYSPTCANCVGDAGYDGHVTPDAGHPGPDADAGQPPAPCTGPKGDNLLATIVRPSNTRSLTGNRTSLFWDGCPPQVRPGVGVCTASKSTGVVSRVISDQYWTTSPLAADETGLWFSPAGNLHRITFGGSEDAYDKVSGVNAIASQKGVTPSATYFAALGGLWVSTPSAIEPVLVNGAPSGQFLAVGSTIAYILEEAGKIHRFDIANQVPLGTLDVGPIVGAAWLNSALFFAESGGTARHGSIKRVDDGSDTVTTLFEVAAPQWLTADDDSLYYADKNSGSAGVSVLHLSPTPGATPEPIATGLQYAGTIHVDSSCVYLLAYEPYPVPNILSFNLRVYPKNKP